MNGPVNRAPARPGAVWAWVIAVASVIMFVASLPSLASTVSIDLAPFGATIAAAAAVGALLIGRVPSNPIGRLMLVAAALTSLAVALAAFGLSVGTATPASRALASTAGLVSPLLYVVSLTIVVILVPLVFPDGRLISARWRWVIVLAGVVVAADSVANVLRPGPLRVLNLDNPLGAPDLVPLLDTLNSLAFAGLTLSVIAVAAGLGIRYRDGGQIERLQLKWIIAVAVFAAITLPVSLSQGAWLVVNLALAALPIAIGIAVLRYRLYEIDHIISRTISWAIITGTLAAVFVLLVLALQSLLSPITGHDSLVIAGSTLVVATLFQPLRSRVQRAVDQRFYRARYDGERVIDAFAEELRDEVDLATIKSDVISAAGTALKPASAALWVRDRPGPGGLERAVVDGVTPRA